MLKIRKTIFAAAVLTAAVSAPMSAHANILSSLVNTVTHQLSESIAKTAEWIVLNSPTYLVWKSVTLPGGACGDGSPYRFFINQSPIGKNTAVYFEGGGGCWDYASCMGTATEVASNPSGIPRNYLTNFKPSNLSIPTFLAHLGVPMVNRVGLDSPTPTRGLDWNYIWVPYCTGDVYSGNNVKFYKEQTPTDNGATRTQYFKGHINNLQMVNWLAQQRNHLFLAPVARPDTLLLTGASAGGYGSAYNYSWFRSRLTPNKSGLLSDSGWMPNLPSPRTSDSKFRGVAIHALDDWNVSGTGGIITTYENEFKRKLGDRENLGDMSLAIAAQWPKDRFIHTAFYSDAVLTGFANQALGGPAWTPEQKLAVMEEEVNRQLLRLDQSPNSGYYIVFARDITRSHVMTAVTHQGTRVITEKGLRYDSVNAAILSALHRSPEPIRAVDASRDIQTTTLSSVLNAIYPE